MLNPCIMSHHGVTGPHPLSCSLWRLGHSHHPYLVFLLFARSAVPTSKVSVQQYLNSSEISYNMTILCVGVQFENGTPK